MAPGKYTLDYYMDIVDKLIEFGAHVIAVKSMSGVMKPAAGRALVRAIRAKYPDIPIHMHTHDTNGAGIACVHYTTLSIFFTNLSNDTATPKRKLRKANVHDGEVAAPMSGNIIRVVAQNQSEVKAGDVLLTIGAMKMVSRLVALPLEMIRLVRENWLRRLTRDIGGQCQFRGQWQG